MQRILPAISVALATVLCLVSALPLYASNDFFWGRRPTYFPGAFGPDSIQMYLDWRKSGTSARPLAPTTLFQPEQSEKANEAELEDSQIRTVQYRLNGKLLTPSQYEGLTLSNQAIEYMKQGLWQRAASNLARAVELYPDLAQAHSSRAYVLARLDQGLEALSEANQAIGYAGNKPDSYCILAQICQGLALEQNAINQYRAVLKRFPHSPAALLSRDALDSLEFEEEVRQLVKAQGKLTDDSANYFAFSTNVVTIKWCKDKLPLKVYIPGDNVSGNCAEYRKQFGEALRDSFKLWQTESNNLVTFTMVPSAEQADIECSWSNSYSLLTNPGEGGETRLKYDFQHGIEHAKICLVATAPGAPSLSVNDVKRIALHQIGHSLGLIGHSATPGDIMYCVNSIVDSEAGLSDCDKKTLALLYRDDTKISASLHLLNLHDNSLAENADGLQLMALGDIGNASEKFESALTINAACEPARRNLATCLQALACDAVKKKRLSDAASDLELLLNLDVGGQDGDRENRASELQQLADVYTKLNRPNDAKDATDALDRLNKLAQNVAVPRSVSKSGNSTETNQVNATGSQLSSPGQQSESTAIRARSTTMDDVDFAPYLQDLQMRVRKAWNPPRGNLSRRLKLVFKIHKGGELSNLNVCSSSGDASCDKSALKAVYNAAPFLPLPSSDMTDIDVMFTFDYCLHVTENIMRTSTIDPEALILRWVIVVQSMPTPENLYGLGYAYEKATKFEAAERQFRKALAVDPGYEPARDALTALLAKYPQREEGSR